MTEQPSHKPVLCAGRLYCDLVFTGASTLPEMGKEVFSEGLSLHAGGGAFITAATLSSLGVPASLLAVLPASPFDKIVRADLTKLGVNSDLCAEADSENSPQLTVAITGKEDRAFLTHQAGAALPSPQLGVGRWTHLHIGELRSLIEHPELLAQAKTSGMTVSLDCGWDEDALSQGTELSQLIAQVDLFLPNEAEFERLCASGMAEDVTKTVVVKCGRNGARALQDGSWIDASAALVSVVDATGAGDAFNGGFLVRWLAGRPLRDCLDYGNQCGACAVQYVGGTGGLDQLRRDPKAADTAKVGG